MLPKHHLHSLIPNRAKMTLQRLHKSVWEDWQALEVEATPASAEPLPWAEAVKLPTSPVTRYTYWGKQFDQRWYHLKFPAGQKGRWLHWNEQSEATLYVDGQPYYGFDVAHRFCRLPEGVGEAWVESNCQQSAIWHPQGKAMKPVGALFEGASLVTRNDLAWGVFHDFKCLSDLMLDLRCRENPEVPAGILPFGEQTPVHSYSPVYRILLRIVDEAGDALDTGGLAAAKERLARGYETLRGEKVFSNCILTGHAHIDLVWIWPERTGELKAVHTFSTMNRLMDEYPEFLFAYSQTASYEAVQRREPEFFKQAILPRIQSGRWEATGALYVESDTMLACGEALGRSFEIGQEGFRRLRGEPSNLVWLPDVFGYAACLPQLMKLYGVRYFFTTKMTWNAINRFPLSSFLWRGSDGSEILSHVSQDVGYVTSLQMNEIKPGMYGNQQADIHDEFLLPTGFGDGGGGPTEEMCERARRLSGLPTMPGMKWGHPEAFFERLDAVRDELPVHEGECYLEYHRGTYTSHGNLKSAFRGLERALQVVEAVAARLGAEVDVTHAWKRLVFAQFHDYIPGSSVWDVYLEGVPELEKLAHEQLEAAGKLLGPGEGGLFNPHAVPVRRWVTGAAGHPVYVELPPLSRSTEEAVALEPPQSVEVGERSLSNGLVEVELDEAGHVSSFVVEGRPVRVGQHFGQLISYPDHPAAFDAWDIDRQALSLGQTCTGTVDIQLEQEGEHRASLVVMRAIGENSQARLRYTVEAGSPHLHVEVGLDWQEAETLLKLYLPTDYRAANARFGAPFGSVLRPQTPNGMVAEARWEVPFSRYLAVFDEGERDGLFVVTESKYGALVRDGAVGLSLVRSPRVTGCGNHEDAWREDLSRLDVPGRFSDMGQHRIALTLGAYNSFAPRERQPAILADTLYTAPLRCAPGEASAPIRGLDGDPNIVPAWVKPLAGGAFLLRLHEVAGRAGEICVRAADGWRVLPCDQWGNATADGGADYAARLRRCEIASVRLEPVD